MWQVQDQGFDVKFTFRHLRGMNYYDGHSGHTITDATKCDLMVNDKAFFGLALCSKDDNFQKEIGRKVALDRAIKAAKLAIELPKPLRQQIWERYFNRMVRNEPNSI